MSSNCSVVVAGDNHEAADTLVELLGAMGYAAVAAYDGREAVEACSALQPELAILDVEIPLLDGCAAARLVTQLALPALPETRSRNRELTWRHRRQECDGSARPRRVR